MNENTSLQEALSNKKLVEIVFDVMHDYDGYGENDEMSLFFIGSDISDVITQAKKLCNGKYDIIHAIKIYDVVVSADVCNAINELAIEIDNNLSNDYIEIPVDKYKKYFPNLETIDIDDYEEFVWSKTLKGADPIFGVECFNNDIRLKNLSTSNAMLDYPWHIRIFD